jgi:beta-lactamase regulating signal transducer with metallopeptidase domain
MIASWMAYSVLVSAGIYFAANALDHALRAADRPARFVWIVALFLSLAACAMALGRSQSADPSRTVGAPTRTLDRPIALPTALTPTRTVSVPAASVINRLDVTLVGLWLAGSLLTLAVFGGAARRLRRIASQARPAELAGVQVGLTADTGPLVIGVLKPRMVLPEWVLALNPAEQTLVIAHEQSHITSRDPALLALPVLGVIVAPWNPVLWYMLRRLRRAVEIDCDRRVLMRHPDVRSYADLLIAVASRSQLNIVTAIGLASSASSLEQRFSFMNRKTSSQRYRIFASLGGGLVALFVTAMVPRPVLQRAPVILNLHGQAGARATGRVSVTGASRYSVAYRAVSRGGTLKELRPRSGDGKISANHSADFSGPRVFDIDVTDGSVEFQSHDTTSLHLEAAMSGASPAAWLSATGPHISVAKGGIGVGFGARQASMRPDTTLKPDTTFFEFQVDTLATPTEAPSPAYPEALKTSGIPGEVWTQFVVDKEGRVDMRAFKTLKSSAPEFIDAVKAVLPSWKFKAATRNGKKVDQVVQQAFQFTKPATR